VTTVLAQEGAAGEGGGAETPAIGASDIAVWAGLALVSLVALGFAGWFSPKRFEGKRDAGALPAGGWLAIAFVAFIGQSLAGGVGLSLVIESRGERLEATALATILGALGAILCAFVCFRTAAPQRPVARGAGLVLTGGDAWVGTLVCLAAIPLVSAAAMLAQLYVGAADPLSHETLRLLSENDSYGVWAMTAFAVVVAAPLAEELIFRGLLQTWLRRLGAGPLLAAGGASLAFIAVHVTVLDSQMMPALFVLSMVLGLSFERTGRLGTPIVAHALFNAFNLWASGV